MEGMKGLILRHHLHLAAILSAIAEFTPPMLGRNGGIGSIGAFGPSTPHVSTPHDTHSVHFPGCGTPTTAAG